MERKADWILKEREKGLNNQGKENQMDTPFDGALNTSAIKSPIKTPVLPTRKNTNRRISVSDLDHSAENSEL